MLYMGIAWAWASQHLRNTALIVVSSSDCINRGHLLLRVFVFTREGGLVSCKDTDPSLQNTTFMAI